MKKLNFISSAVVAGVVFLSGSTLFAQCPLDTVGNCDTLFVEKTPSGRILPNSEFVVWVWGYHDENLAGIAIPLRFKTTQFDVTLDSARIHPNVDTANIKDLIQDTVGDGSIGKITILLIWFGAPLSAGVDTFATLYFTTGPSWDPSICNYIDTFTLQSGQGLSFTDVNATDIIPLYEAPRCVEVKDNNRFPTSLRPSTFSLSQNFPNPFNTETVITFALPHSSHVRIEIFNILGQKVRDLVDEGVSAGYKKVFWDGRDNSNVSVASGVYFYRIRASDFVDVKKMTLLK